MARPSEQPRWAETVGGTPNSGAIVDPTSGKKDVGWADVERPPAEYLNWWMHLVYLWIAWLASWTSGGQAVEGPITVTGSLTTNSDLTAAGTCNFTGAGGVGISHTLVMGTGDITATTATFSGSVVVAGNLKPVGALYLFGVISPAALTTNTNDYAPAGGVDSVSTIRISSTGTVDLTGIVAPAVDGHVLVLMNVGAQAINLRHASGSSSAANQFLLAGNADFGLTANACAILRYDAFSTAWRCVGKAT